MLIYMRCINCGLEVSSGNINTAFRKWSKHFYVCEPIREVWCWETIHRRVLQRDNYTCQECGAKGELEVHHITPISKKGTNNPRNLITLCPQCHRRKTNSLLRELRGAKEDG